MDIPDKIQACATIREVISPRTCHAILPNGKVIFAFTAKQIETLPLHEGGKVIVRMDVADFSRGEMLRQA